MKVHPTLTLPQAMWMAKFSETEYKDRTMQMVRVRQAKASQMPMLGTDIAVVEMSEMLSLSGTEALTTQMSIPTVSNASSATAEVATTLLFPTPQPKEPPHLTAQAKQKV
jgi:hypothetical protein